MKSHIVLVVLTLGIAVAVVALAVAGWGSAPCPVDVRQETFERLKPDMGEPEVEAILGGPAGDYRTRAGVKYQRMDSAGIMFPIGERFEQGTESRWLTDGYAIYVSFDADGKAWLIYGLRALPALPSMRYPPPLRQLMRHFDP